MESNLNESRIFDILEKLPVNCKIRQHYKFSSPLSLAITYRNFDLVKRLIDRGEDVNFVDETGESILMKLCKSTYLDESKLKVLLNCGVNLNHQDCNGNTVLHILVGKRFPQLVSLLIINGAQINTQNVAGETALFRACFLNQNETALQLIQQGADVNLCDKSLRSPLYIASSQNMKEVVTVLLERGARFNDQDLLSHFIVCQKCEKCYFLDPIYQSSAVSFCSACYVALLADAKISGNYRPIQTPDTSWSKTLRLCHKNMKMKVSTETKQRKRGFSFF